MSPLIHALLLSAFALFALFVVLGTLHEHFTHKNKIKTKGLRHKKNK